MTAALFLKIIIIKISNEHLNRMTYPCIQHCYQRDPVKETIVKIKIIKGSCEQLMDECFLLPLFRNQSLCRTLHIKMS